VEVWDKAGLDGGTVARGLLGEIELLGDDGDERRPKPPSAGLGQVNSPPDGVTICMATHNPDPELFSAQVASIRAQTVQDWDCIVSDDCSEPRSLEQIRAELGDDPRFRLEPSKRRLGFYRNFERALSLVPKEAGLVALADQDDRWLPEKLAALRESIGPAQLVYSDQRLVTADGDVLAETYWTARRNNHSNLASLLVANTVTGAASMFRRELLEYALPFPPAPGYPYHDHWLGLVALSTGELAYVDRWLYDYVQHGEAALGHARANAPASARLAWLQRLRHGERPAVGWRSTYFLECCRLQLMATVLLLRCGDRLIPAKRRTLERFLRAENSPLAASWLLGRSLRSLGGRNETLGAERRLATGIAWRHALTLLAFGRNRPWPGISHDASLPEGYEPETAHRPEGS
jgi:glycosyltransferase involved in cell wall biosynthesis